MNLDKYLKDTLMMFQYIDSHTFRKIKESIIYFEATYIATLLMEQLKI